MGKNKKIRNNKVLLGILLVCIIAIGILFYKFFYAGAGGTKYGNRLNGIENYPLSSNLQDEIKSLYSDNSKVGTVKVNTEGRVIYVDIDFKESLKVNEAKSLAEKALEKIGENNLTYYDVHFILTYSGEEENENFPLFGAKSSNSLKVVW
mgnify:FL=1